MLITGCSTPFMQVYGFTMSIFKTVSGIAKFVSTDVRSVLAVNPQALPFTFPPQVAMGLTVAGQVAGAINSIAGTKLKVPTEAELKAIALGQYQGVLKGATRDVIASIEALKKGTATVDNALETIQRVDWLLTLTLSVVSFETLNAVVTGLPT